ncbi:MAG: hypothetical protein JSS63_05890 [Bacteroidetes bacterium]|nr:hypothetical protein [Bacteroidota bacterium]
MKKTFSAILLFLLFFISKLSFSQADLEITDRIIYSVSLDSLNSSSKKELLNTLCNLVYDGKIQPARYLGESVHLMPEFYNVLRIGEAKEYFYWDDTIKYYPDTTTDEMKRKRDNRVYRTNISNLSFLEKWYFNTKLNIFVKKIKGVILFQDEYTHNVGMRENYYLPLNDTIQNRYLQKFLIRKNIMYDVPITKKNFNENSESNWWYNYLEPSKREKFFSLLTYKALRDSIAPLPVYSPYYPYDTLLKSSNYINSDLVNLYYGRTIWYGSDPLLFGMTDEKILQCCFELADWTTIKKIRFHEDWYFDPDNLHFEKKILGIGMIVDTYDELGQVNGEKCLVYYKLQN